jgi:ABC-type antimicrobial peptide transport system permease subunit
MTETKSTLRCLLGLAFKAFILASVMAVILPMPHYASSLSDEEYIVWLARLLWVLMLTFGVGVVLLLATAVASFLPALRAARMDPVRALRLD